MVHLTNSIQPHYMMYYYPERCTTNPAHVEEIKAKASESIAAAWERVDKALAASGPYMAGDRFSAADLPVVMLTGWQQARADVLDRNKHIRRLVELVSARPAIGRVLKQNQAAA